MTATMIVVIMVPTPFKRVISIELGTDLVGTNIPLNLHKRQIYVKCIIP